MPARNVRASVRPSPGTNTGRVWEIADEITKTSGKQATRQAVIARYEAEGGKYNTASTQYYHWKLNYDASRGGRNSGMMPITSVTLQLKEGGRVVIPADMRAALGVKEGDVLNASLVDGELRLFSRNRAIQRLQERARQLVPAGTLVSEELIADRRGEATRE